MPDSPRRVSRRLADKGAAAATAQPSRSPSPASPTTVQKKTSGTRKVRTSVKPPAGPSRVKSRNPPVEPEGAGEDNHFVCPFIPSNSIIGQDIKELVNPKEWEKLSDAKKAILLKLLPPCDKVFPRGDDSIDPAHPQGIEIHPRMWEGSRFKWMRNQLGERIREGRYEPRYQKMVLAISRRRRAQEFEPYKDEKAERYWGQKRVNLSGAIAGESATVGFATLARYRVLRAGDVFSLRRSFQGNHLIEKEATLTEFDSVKGQMTFSYPPKRMKTSVEGIDDLIATGITAPSTLERILCTENGSGPKPLPNGNAFKTIYIIRNGEELGSLFELRSEFYQQYLAPDADKSAREALEVEYNLPRANEVARLGGRFGAKKGRTSPKSDDEEEAAPKPKRRRASAGPSSGASKPRKRKR